MANGVSEKVSLFCRNLSSYVFYALVSLLKGDALYFGHDLDMVEILCVDSTVVQWIHPAAKII